MFFRLTQKTRHQQFLWAKPTSPCWKKTQTLNYSYIHLYGCSSDCKVAMGSASNLHNNSILLMLKTANCSLQWLSVCGYERGGKKPTEFTKVIGFAEWVVGVRLEGAIQGTLTVDATFLFIQREKEKKPFWWHKMIKRMELIIPTLCVITVFKFKVVSCWLLCALPSSCDSISESVLIERLKRERWCLQNKFSPPSSM